MYLSMASIYEKIRLKQKKHIGFLPQKPPLHPDLTVDEYLIHCATLRRMEKSKIREAVEIAKERCAIAHFSKRLIKNLSGGYQQRVGIAQAIVHNPPFVVLDEPTNGLDPVGIQQIRLLIQKLCAEKGTTILISSHILSEIEQMANTIGIIDHGKMIEELSMDEIRRRNRHYVKMTVSDMNRTVPLLEKELCITDFEIVSEREIKIYQIETDFEKVNRLLNQNEIGVSEISMNKGNLEEYFLRLTGGNSIG